MNGVYVLTQHLTDEKGVTHLFHITIDAKAVIRAMAPKVLANKSKRSKALNGAVLVKVA